MDPRNYHFGPTIDLWDSLRSPATSLRAGRSTFWTHWRLKARFFSIFGPSKPTSKNPPHPARVCMASFQDPLHEFKPEPGRFTSPPSADAKTSLKIRENFETWDHMAANGRPKSEFYHLFGPPKTDRKIIRFPMLPKSPKFSPEIAKSRFLNGFGSHFGIHFS